MREQYIVSTTIKHKGERGRQREEGLKRFLSEHLPEAYGIATGEIFPCIGDDVSPQCDIVIYDRMKMPIFGKNSAVQQIPLEAVYAVIEVKSELNSSALSDFKGKLEKIRAMPRSRKSFASSQAPLFYLFGYKFRTKEKACTTFIMENSIEDDVSITALDRGLTLRLEEYENPIWLTTSDHNDDFYETLVFFFVDLLEGLNGIKLETTSFVNMLYNHSQNP